MALQNLWRSRWFSDAFSPFFAPLRQTPNLSLSRGGDSTHTVARLISRTGVLRPETGGVTPHSMFDSCRPTAAILGDHGASGPVRCVPPPHGSCRASSCGLEYMDVWRSLSARGWSHAGAGRRALSSEEKHLVVSSFLTVRLFGSLSMTQKRRVTGGNHKQITS